MGDLTVCHIIDGSRLLLIKNVRGISKGKWNAPGGKIEAAETPEEGAIREVQEETGLKIADLAYHGPLNFYMDGQEALSFTVHLFSTKGFGGEVKSSSEGEVKWFDIDKIPYEEMWDDDIYWMPLMLKGRRFAVDFYYDKDNKKVVRCIVTSND